MRRRAFAVLSMLVIVGFATTSLYAQAAQQSQTGGAPPPPQTMDLATAKRMVFAAETAATAMNAHVAICVLDSNGDVVFYERMDTAPSRAVTSAQGKARAALLFGIPTAQVAEAMRGGKPVSATLTPPIAGNWEITLQQGGLPIIKDGKVIGAIGAGGSAPGNDEKFAQAGIEAALGK